MAVGPLTGCRVWEVADTPAGGFVGRVLASLGASVEMLEPSDGSALRTHPPYAEGRSALFDYLGADKTTRPLPDVLDPNEVSNVNIVVHDRRNLPEGWDAILDSAPQPERGRVVVSVLPYGRTGPKAEWEATELTIFQGGGEGYLMPSGLGFEEFPDRPPIGVGRYVGSYQGALTGALTAVAGLRSSRLHGITEWVDISVQDAQLSLNYFTFSRYIEGVEERRANRAFSYGGVIRSADGYVELVPLEQHQWLSLRTMLGDPEWAFDPKFEDPLDRASHGAEINHQLAEWASTRTAAEITELGVFHGVPCGPYTAPETLPYDPQFDARGFFVPLEGGGRFPGLPIHFDRWARSSVRPAPEAPLRETA